MDTEYFREKLLALRQETLEVLKKGNEATKTVELDQAMMGRLSRMDAMQQQEMALASKHRREKRILQIDQALKRMEEGEFGYCLSCGEEIAFKRLDLNPVVLTCINCAS